ncbi:MAG TPA: hypothetical protein P5547_14010 [Spirochaetota bacterium]|nr:hypothetical protein [Spirochaetota bacterium]
MKKILFFLIDFVGNALTIGISIGLTCLIGFKVIFPSNLKDSLQRWLFMILFGLMLIVFLTVWNIIASNIKRRLINGN